MTARLTNPTINLAVGLDVTVHVTFISVECVVRLVENGAAGAGLVACPRRSSSSRTGLRFRLCSAAPKPPWPLE